MDGSMEISASRVIANNCEVVVYLPDANCVRSGIVTQGTIIDEECIASKPFQWRAALRQVMGEFVYFVDVYNDVTKTADNLPISPDFVFMTRMEAYEVHAAAWVRDAVRALTCMNKTQKSLNTYGL